ncbi:MAG: thermosome subunit beta [Candidatus Bathyarchaeia archaeon]
MLTSAVNKVNAKPVLVLREGAGDKENSLLNSIQAARTVSEVLKSSLGPKGMDKMLINNFGDIIITNDGRTMLQEMDLQHPVARMMVDVAKTIDNEVGDGTTSSVVVAGELLGKAEQLIKKGIHPTLIADGYEKASEKALETLDNIAITISLENKNELKKIAATSLASKIISNLKEPLSEVVVSAIFSVIREVDGKNIVDLDDVMVEKKLGESLASTNLVKGVIINKEIIHPAMPKRVEEARIALIDKALDLEKAQFDSKIRIDNPEQIEEFIKQEDALIGKLVDKIASTGANVLILQEDLNKLANYLLAKKGILTIRRVNQSIMKKVAKATGGHIINNFDALTEKDLGFAEVVEERTIGGSKLLFVENCRNPHSVAILIRGANKRIVDEAERSIHDALCVVRDVVQEQKIVAGGGAPEIEVARSLRKYAVTLVGKEQLAVNAYADALEIVPATLSENAGLNSIDTLPELRSCHEKGEVWAGVNVYVGKIQDMKSLEVYEPLSVKKQIIKSATEAAIMILKVDEIVSTKKQIRREEQPKKSPEEDRRERMEKLQYMM